MAPQALVRTKKTKLPSDAPLVDPNTGKMLCENVKGKRRYMGQAELLHNKKWQRVTAAGKAVVKRPKGEKDGAVIVDGPGSEADQAAKRAAADAAGEDPEGEDPEEPVGTTTLKSIPDVIALIKAATTAKEVDALVKGDDRATVDKAATKRKGELSKGE